MEIVDLLPFDPVVSHALSHFVKEKGVFKAVLEGKGELDLFTFTTPWLTTLVVENKVNLSSTILYYNPQFDHIVRDA